MPRHLRYGPQHPLYCIHIRCCTEVRIVIMGGTSCNPIAPLGKWPGSKVDCCSAGSSRRATDEDTRIVPTSYATSYADLDSLSLT